MTIVLKRRLENILKKFNDEEKGGGYLYVIYDDELVQIDLMDYSTIAVCNIMNIKNVQFFKDDEGIYLELEDLWDDDIDHVWINEMGVQM